MSDIKLLSAHDFDALTHIWAGAYPGAKIVTEEERERFREQALRLHEEDPTANFYGLFRDGQLLGIMCFYDFETNFLGTLMPAGGVGQVAVDLLHKKEHVAKEMMGFFLRHYRERGVPLLALYPFRPDFYRAMGFGYGPKMSQYRVPPTAFPRGPSRAHVRALGPDDKDAIRACYDRVAGRTHGMMRKTEREMRGLLRRPENHIVGVDLEGQIRGYLVYTFENGENFLTNDIHVQEWIYETPMALSELLTFLHTQADQLRAIIVDTQDEDFHHLLLVGLMYRVVDVPGILDRLAKHDFGGQTLTLELVMKDSFLPENGGSTLLRFEAGRLRRIQGGEPDVQVCLAIEDFSSLLAGTVAFRSLYNYGRAETSAPDDVDLLTSLFAVERKPICMTHF
ncbi:MAG: GNAT family N-acetyltransferase [Anaerolineae bacterium]